MRIIDTKPGAPEKINCLVTGDPGSGKTAFVGTWPRPLLLCDDAEKSWTTIQHLEDDHFYEPGFRPYVIAIEEPSDLFAVRAVLDRQAAGEKIDHVPDEKGKPLAPWPVPQGKWQIGTVGIDTFSEYAASYLAMLEAQAGSDLQKLRQSLYGDLRTHLQHVQISFQKKLPYHIVLTAHVGGKMTDFGYRGASLPGSYDQQLPYKSDLWIYLEQVGTEDVEFNAWTRPYRGNYARHRYGKKLDPVIEPHFGVIEECLGMAPFTERLAKGKSQTGSKGKK